MSKFWLWASLLSSMWSFALDDQDVDRYKSKFQRNNAHMVSNGRHIDLYLPVDEVYLGQTSYFKNEQSALMLDVEELVKHSTGSIELVGFYDETVIGSFDTSALYAQVSHFSAFLLSKNKDVSFSPMTIKRYVRNDDYGFFKRFNGESKFIMLSLSS